jgi:prepilin-type N-terminal cleavage/methylation domain-containing protein
VRGRISENYRKPRFRSGFTLIEVLLVVLIMGIVLGMTASLLGGFYNMFETTEDQSVAKMRAQDVFNMLNVPIQNAGIGVPSSDLNLYFDITGGTAPEVAAWTAPLTIAKGTSGSFDAVEGDRMRVIYALPTGLKTVQGTNVPAFSAIGARTDAAVDGNIQFIDSLPSGITADSGNLSSFITFPGMDMHPFYVKSKNSATEIVASSKKPWNTVSPDLIGSNVVRAYHDLYAIRAAVAYVDADNNFCLIELGADPSVSSPAYPAASSSNFNGFRVEGIAGIYFEQDTAGRYVTVRVLAEGDVMNSQRDDNTEKRQALATWWNGKTGITFNPGVLYEELSMTYRTRNLQR